MFLDDTGSETFPEFWDNPDYNRPDQPVVGVSFEDANRFAAWLSIRLGVARRLPTEDEWEKAARGGLDAIYPWGDQSPLDGARANYSGNGRFAAPSPVGSFAAGRNAYGLYDMAGNVWQWTSTPAGAGTGRKIVKGGSWMDGPTDLRVSNRRDVDSSQGYVDVGFRLVREALHD
jgi:formylglycine-generating enzyme required for sulfatase activity